MNVETINYKNRELEVHFKFDPGEPMVWTYSNGDPGHPGSPPEYEIYHVFLADRDIFRLLDYDDLVGIENALEDERGRG